MVRVRIVPEAGRLTAVLAPMENSGPPGSAAQQSAAQAAGAGAPAPAAQRAPAVAGAPAPVAPPPIAAPPAGLPVDFAAGQYKTAERALGELLKALVQSNSSDLHLRGGEPPVVRTHGEMERQATPPVNPRSEERRVGKECRSR